MLRYIGKRLLLMIPIILAVAVIIVSLMYVIPGDVVTQIAGNTATPAEIEELREQLGLNRPFIVQLLDYLQKVFLRFDFGNSLINGTSISKEIAVRLPRSLILAIGSMVLAILIGIPLGVTAATHENGLADNICMIISLLGVSMPNFWLGILLVLLFSVQLGWLPPSGADGPLNYILPIIATGLASAAQIARQTRSNMLEVIRSDYVTSAREKGLSEFEIIYKHALPNALIPVIAVIGNTLAMTVGGMVVMERVFSIPGVGAYLISGVNSRDYYVVQAVVIVLSIVFSFIILLTDIVFALVDPRIKAQYTGKRKKKKETGKGAAS